MCQQLSAPLPTTGNSISFLVVPLRIQVIESITVVLYLVLLHHMVIILESSSTFSILQLIICNLVVDVVVDAYIYNCIQYYLLIIFDVYALISVMILYLIT